MKDFFIHENLKKFIFPNAPNSWIATNTFFIQDNVCSIVQDSITIPKDTPPYPIMESSVDYNKDYKNDDGDNNNKDYNKDNNNNSKDNKDNKEDKNNKDKIEIIKEENFKKLFHMLEDLQQNEPEKMKEDTFDELSKKWDISALLYFSSICFKEYQKCESSVKQNLFIKKSRLFSKLIMGIFYVNNVFVTSLKDFKKCKDFTFQDVESIKNLLEPFDILEKEVFELIQTGKKYNPEEMFLVLANIHTKEIYGIAWSFPWKQSKECEYIKIEDKEKLTEIEKCLYIKALHVTENNKKIGDTEKMKALLYMLLLSENQVFQYEHVLWKPPKIGDFPSLKEIIQWKTFFEGTPTFALEEGILKLPKQETSCEILFQEESKYISSFREVSNHLKSFEKCKKYKFIKDEFIGLWKDIQNKTLTIVLKKKVCAPNIFLCHHDFPNPFQFMKYFLFCQENYEEEDSLTTIEKILSFS